MQEESTKDKIRYICILTAVGSGIVTILLAVSIYELYLQGRANRLLIETVIVCLVICILSALLSFLLRDKKSNQALVSLSLRENMEILGLVGCSDYRNYEIEDFGENAEYSRLWKQLIHAKPIKQIFLLVFFVVLTMIVGYSGYNVWFYKNGRAGIFPWGDSGVYMVPLFGHILICIILIVYIVGVCDGLRPRGNAILRYIKEHQLNFEEINKEFINALYCGDSVWMGENYLFIRQLNASFMVSMDEIVSVAYNYAFGKLYYYLIIETKEQAITKYCIDRKTYTCLKDELQRRGDFSEEE
ncbi:MAG: hypothetical protein E7264_06670 [Lachnospiraceae bacterium]|nr:hypothetical protein [Lachnospiraceae bacterium]